MPDTAVRRVSRPVSKAVVNVKNNNPELLGQILRPTRGPGTRWSARRPEMTIWTSLRCLPAASVNKPATDELPYAELEPRLRTYVR